MVDFAGEPPFALPVESQTTIGNWDVALMDFEGGLALVPAVYFPGHTSSRARISVVTGTAFPDVERASSDSADYTAQPVPVRANEVYVVRSRAARCIDGTGGGVHYAKLRAIEIDVAAGRLRFETVNNPFCTQRSFIPPNED